MIQRVVALLAGSRYPTADPVARRGARGDLESLRRALAWGSVLALAVALAGFGFMRWPLSAVKVGDSLNAALGASPRLHWSAPRAATFSALPWPSVRIDNARLDDSYGVNLLSAPAARLNLSLIDLLRGRFIPTGAILVGPTVRVDIDSPPFAGAAGGSAGPASVARALAPLTSLSLSNGVLRLVSLKRGVDTLIDNVQGRFDGLTVGDQLRFNLSAVWRQTPVKVAGVLNDPETAAKGAPSSILFALDSPLAKLAFGGALALTDKPSAEGDFTASVPSIAALTAFLAIERPPLLADDIAIKAKIKAAPHAATLSQTTLTSAGQTVEGALAIDDIGGRPAVSGTLAAETLAMSPLLGPPRRFFDSLGAWSVKPFALAALKTFDLDLRLSASHLDVYGQTLADAAASVIVSDGKLNMNLIEAAAYGGRLEGAADVACLGQGLKMSARGELVDANLGAALADFGRPAATGRGGARFDVASSGASPAALVAGLSGAASLEAADGAILGVNLEEALRRSRRRPIDVERDMRLGGTAFDKLDVSLAFIDGRARVERGAMTSRGVTAELGGLIDLVAQRWALRLDAVQTDAAGRESQDAGRLALDIAGPWSAPTIRAVAGSVPAEPASASPPSR
jgi:AsmA protein